MGYWAGVCGTARLGSAEARVCARVELHAGGLCRYCATLRRKPTLLGSLSWRLMSADYTQHSPVLAAPALPEPAPSWRVPRGAPTGVVGAVVLPVTGVGVGAVQLVRGVINTPEAVMQSSQGKLWDEVSCLRSGATPHAPS